MQHTKRYPCSTATMTRQPSGDCQSMDVKWCICICIRRLCMAIRPILCTIISRCTLARTDSLKLWSQTRGLPSQPSHVRSFVIRASAAIILTVCTLVRNLKTLNYTIARKSIANVRQIIDVDSIKATLKVAGMRAMSPRMHFTSEKISIMALICSNIPLGVLTQKQSTSIVKKPMEF